MRVHRRNRSRRQYRLINWSRINVLVTANVVRRELSKPCKQLSISCHYYWYKFSNQIDSHAKLPWQLEFTSLVLGSRSRSYFTTDGQSVSMSWCRAHSGICDQILLPVRGLLSESWGPVSVGRPLWREAGSAVCNASGIMQQTIPESQIRQIL
jgi:hypothetical protein